MISKMPYRRICLKILFPLAKNNPGLTCELI